MVDQEISHQASDICCLTVDCPLSNTLYVCSTFLCIDMHWHVQIPYSSWISGFEGWAHLSELCLSSSIPEQDFCLFRWPYQAWPGLLKSPNMIAKGILRTTGAPGFNYTIRIRAWIWMFNTHLLWISIFKPEELVTEFWKFSNSRWMLAFRCELLGRALVRLVRWAKYRINQKKLPCYLPITIKIWCLLQASNKCNARLTLKCSLWLRWGKENSPEVRDDFARKILLPQWPCIGNIELPSFSKNQCALSSVFVEPRTSYPNSTVLPDLQAVYCRIQSQLLAHQVQGIRSFRPSAETGESSWFPDKLHCHQPLFHRRQE